MRIFSHEFIVMRKNTLHKFVFFLRLRLYHVLPVMRVKEELTGFRVRNELQKVVISLRFGSTEGHNDD